MWLVYVAACVCSFSLVLFVLFFTLPPPPTSPLFPYTTLFRSRPRLRRRTEATWTTAASARASPSTCPSRPMARFSTSATRSEEHTSELQSLRHLVCRLLLEKKKKKNRQKKHPHVIDKIHIRII